MPLSKVATITITTVSLLMLSACAVNGGEIPKANGEKIKVTASTSVWGSVARAVGGDGVEVSSIITEETPQLKDNPEAQNLLRQAQVVVVNGNKFDDSIIALLKNPNPKQIVLNAASISGSDSSTNTATKQLFYSIKAVKAVATKLNNSFSKIAPKNKEIFAANLQIFNKKLDDLQIDAQQVGQEHPDTTVLDPSGGTDPLLQEMGIKNIGGSGDKASMLALISKDKPKMIILSKDPKNIELEKEFKQAAKQADLPVVLVYSVLPEGVLNYYDFMRNTIEAIHTGIHK